MRARANNGSEVCGSSECPDYCVFAHARMSCRCSHNSRHACITNSSGEFVISYEHLYSCAPILAWYRSIFYTNYCENNTQELENIYENKDFILFHKYSNPILAFKDQKSTY